MSYQINFKSRDEPSITVNTERGEKIKALWFEGQKATPIDIDGNAYLIGSISSILQVNDPVEFNMEDYISRSTIPLLPSQKTCQAQYSIQKEINRIAKEEHPKNWAKLIQDTDWREETRLNLHNLTDVWCDYKINLCSCHLSTINS